MDMTILSMWENTPTCRYAETQELHNKTLEVTSKVSGSVRSSPSLRASSRLSTGMLAPLREPTSGLCAPASDHLGAPVEPPQVGSASSEMLLRTLDKVLERFLEGLAELAPVNIPERARSATYERHKGVCH